MRFLVIFTRSTVLGAIIFLFSQATVCAENGDFFSHFSQPQALDPDLHSPTGTVNAIASTRPIQEPLLEPVTGPLHSAPQTPSNSTEEPSPSQDPLKAHAVTLDISSNSLDYDKALDSYVASGNVHVLISEQNSELIADKVIYDQNKDFLIAIGHVIINKEGQKTLGTYAKIDLARKSALIKDVSAYIAKVQIQAKESLSDASYMQMGKGKITIDLARFVGTFGGGRTQKRSKNRESFANTINESKKQDQADNDDTVEMDSPYDLSFSPYAKSLWGNMIATQNLNLQNNSFDSVVEGASAVKQATSPFSYHVRELDIHRGEDGFDDISMDWPTIMLKGHVVAGLPESDGSYDEVNKEFRYLGPEIGYNPDFGGLYAGPTWHFRLGNGFVSLSPIATYGGGALLQRSGQNLKLLPVGPGVGFVGHYRDHFMRLDYGISSKVGQSMLYFNRKLWDKGKVRVMAAWNREFNDGFVGFERPQYIAQIYDMRRVWQNRNIQLDSFTSMGYAKDDFFPTDQKSYFVKATTPTPLGAGRAQLQLRAHTIRPVFNFHNLATLGFDSLLSSAAYTTGDSVLLLRAGPGLDIHPHPKWDLSLQYFVSKSMGKTPFVFDSYYQGDQTLMVGNTFIINDYLAIGFRENLNLLRQNAKNAMMVGNVLYGSIGPRDIKLNLAYDFISRRSYFSLSFFPGADSGKTTLDFDRLKLFEPVNYANPNPMAPPNAF